MKAIEQKKYQEDFKISKDLYKEEFSWLVLDAQRDLLLGIFGQMLYNLFLSTLPKSIMIKNYSFKLFPSEVTVLFNLSLF